MSELVPTNKPTPSRDPHHRAPADEPGRRFAGPGGADLAAQLAARAPGTQPRETTVGVAGEAVFRSPDPRYDGRPVAEVDAELDAIIARYTDGVGDLEGSVREVMALAQKSYGPLGAAAEALAPGEAPSPARWLGVVQGFTRVRGMLAAATAVGRRPEGLVAKARVAAQAVQALEVARADANATMFAQSEFTLGSAKTARSIAKGVEYARDLAILFVITQGAVAFAPSLGAGGAVGLGGGAAAPTTIAGTLAGAGKVAVLGASVRGTVMATGTALGGGDLDQVGAAAGAGMRDGAVDAVMGANGRAARAGLGSSLGDSSAPAIGALSGTYGGAAKAALGGGSRDGVAEAAAGAGARSGLREAMWSALGSR